MKHYIITGILSFLILSGCKKEDLPYTYIGKVTGRNGNSVAGATVELNVYYDAPNAITSGGLYKLTSTKTDNAGNFKVNFNYASGARYFETRVYADNYFPYFSKSIFPSIIQNGTLTFNPIIYKLATLKITFKNTSPVSATDDFSVFHSNELSGPPFDTFIERQFSGGTFNNLERRYIGSNVQGYVITKTKGDTTTSITWSTRKNGVNSYTIDSVVVAGGTQGIYNINY